MTKKDRETERAFGAKNFKAQSFDESLNAHTYSVRSSKTQLWWPAWSSICVVILVIVAVCGAYRVWGTGSAASRGEVAIGLQLAPTNLDIRNTSGTSIDQLLVGNVYETLLTRDSNNGVNPGIAQSWDVSNDRLTYTFHIASGRTFSNDDVLDAQDVVWSISTMMSEELQGADGLENFDSITAPDAHTVVLKLTKPFSALLWNLTGRTGVVLDRDAKYDAKTEAIGSGPYVLAQYEPGVSAKLVADPNYNGTHAPHTKTVNVKYYAEPQAGLNALTSGDVDVLAPIDSNLTSAIKDNSRFSYQAGEGTDKYVLAFNNKTGVLTDKRIRQAIRYAIDNEAIIASRGGTDVALGGPIPSLDPGYEDLTALYPTDVGKAKKLMAEAGYGEGGKNTRTLKLRLTYANTYPAEIGQQLRSQLAKIGIDLTVNRTEFATWLSSVYTNRNYDISLVDHNESHDFQKWADPEYYFGYDNARVKKLYRDAMAASTDNERDDLLSKAARIVSEDAAADWIFNFRVVTAWDKKISGFPINMNQTFMPLWEMSVNA